MNIKLIGSTFFAAMLAACGSAKDANNGNFEKAINAHFAKDCIRVQPMMFGVDTQRYPMTFVLEQKNRFTSQTKADNENASMTQPVDVLAKAGLLSVSEGTKQVKPMFSPTEITAPTKVYSLTDLGKKALISGDKAAMCAGHYKVDEIVRFTQPNNAMGQTVSQVSLTASPVDVPDWAKNADVRKTYNLDSQLEAHRKVTTVMVLASDGWIEASDFGR